MAAAVHAEVQRAAQFDAAGNHDEAINCLARGAQVGDAGCMRLLGLRLVTGEHAPRMPPQGLELLADACARGDGEAGARGAAIIALGAGVSVDWPLALQWLTRAAQQSHEPARRQLVALCDDRALADSAPLPARSDWPALAGAIDLDAWRRAPVADILCDAPRISVFRQMVRPQLCDFFISLADGRLERSKVYDPVSRQDIVYAHRSNTQANFGLHAVEFAQVLLQARMAAACAVPAVQMEAPSVLHYAPGEQISNHYDFVDPATTPDYADEIARNGQRIITFLIYLNDDYEGGATDFPTLGVRYKGNAGDGIYFTNATADLAPDLRMLHAGMPPTRGEKWLVTQFVRSRAMR
jgi:prolyl 4-hydroxylase